MKILASLMSLSIQIYIWYWLFSSAYAGKVHGSIVAVVVMNALLASIKDMLEKRA